MKHLLPLLLCLWSLSATAQIYTYKPTAYTYGFNTNATAAQARAYLGVTNSSIADTNIATLNGTNIFTGATNRFVGTNAGLSGTASITIKPSALSGTNATDNWLNITGTLPTNITATTRGVYIEATSAGTNTGAQVAARVMLVSGLTGAAQTSGLQVGNSAAGTLLGSYIGPGTSRNMGANITATGVTAGNNAGIVASASGSSNYNVGGAFSAVSATSGPDGNYGVYGAARNGTDNVGGLFTLFAGEPSLSIRSAALMASNADTTNAVFMALDLDTPVFTIADGGAVTSTSTMQATGFHVSGTQVVGPQAAAVADATNTVGTASIAGFGFATAAEFNAHIDAVNALKAQVNDLLAKLRTHGLIAP